MSDKHRWSSRLGLLGATLLLASGCANLPGIYKRPGAISVAAAPAAAPVDVPPGGEGPVSDAPVKPALQAPAVAAVGALAPDIAFFDAQGQRHLLSEFKGKFLALVFFAHW